MSIYGIHRQLHTPTGIEHAVCCNFFSASEKNLVIAGNTELSVYRIDYDLEDPSSKSKLECLGRFGLFGCVQSMQAVRLAGACRDALVLTFVEAKLSLVEYDPAVHDLRTSSLHCFEEEHLRDGLLQHFDLPLVRVDPENRCAVMTVMGRHLAVLPFKKESVIDEADDRIQRAPVLSSFTIDLHKLDEKICNVLDIQFLYGYYEPTLLILYEPSRTWTGRIAMRQDTCCIAAISLNIAEKVHPIIWTITNLPYDCHMALPVPKPLGGALIFAANSLLYLNQSFPPFAVSLNSSADISTVFPLKQQEGLKIALDCCTASFIYNDRFVLSLKGGELYVVTLIIDSMTRSVRTFNFDKAASSVLTSCICVCDGDFLFLGSRLGNSLLLKYSQKEEKAVNNDMVGVEPPIKKSKANSAEDLEVYGSEKATDVRIATYSFEVHDSIINIGPCGRVEIGEPPFLSEEFNETVDPDLELVTTSGYGKNGSLSILQRSIRPQVVTTFEAADLPGCYDMWTVVGPSTGHSAGAPVTPSSSKTQTTKASNGEDKTDEAGEEKAVDLKNAHSYLLLSRYDSSMILETGQEIMELDHSGFSTRAPTVYAGNLCNNKFILQVSPHGVRLLKGVNQIQHIPVDLGSPIVHCSTADPYIVILSRDGATALLQLKEDKDESKTRLTISKPEFGEKSKLVALCLYKDVSGHFSCESRDLNMAGPEVQSAPINVGLNVSKEAESMTVDDEDAMLYGEEEMETEKHDPAPMTPDANKPNSKTGQSSDKNKEPTYWMAAAREDGTMEIYSVPDFGLVMTVKNFPQGHRVLIDSRHALEEDKQSADSGQSELPVVKEMLLIGMGPKKRRVCLMAVIEEDLNLYEVYPYHHPVPEEGPCLKIRFKRVDHSLVLFTRKGKARRKEGEPEEVSFGPPTRVLQLRPFDDVAGYSGVFICGPYPHWLFMTSRGVLRTHPMSIDGSVTSFAPFHNVNCLQGFLYFNKKGDMRIGSLPSHLTYDSVWPMRKIPLRATPHFVLYHPGSKTYLVCTSTLENCTVYPRWEDEDILFDPVEVNDRYVYPTTDKFTTQLYSPLAWEPIPNTKIEYEDFEHVTCLTHVLLKSEGTMSGVQSYIVVGTNSCYGEELTARGKIILMEVIEVVPEPGQPLTKTKIKRICTDEQKGPVTAISHVSGLLITAIGQKIYIWQLKDNNISPVSFIDTQIYIHSMVTVKNIIIIADVLKGVSLLRYQSDMRVLSVVSKENQPMEAYGINFFVDNAQLGFVVTDKENNLVIYSYEPTLKESAGGQWLVRKADINLGTRVVALFRVKCKLSDPSSDRKPAPIIEKRHVTYYGSLDGSVGCILPISEKTYRRLFMLQNFLDSHLPHFAGLNPKTFRIYKTHRKILINPLKNIIDGDLVWRYLSLSNPDKIDLAKKMGTSVQQINDDILEVDRLTAHF